MVQRFGETTGAGAVAAARADRGPGLFVALSRCAENLDRAGSVDERDVSQRPS